MTQAKVLPFCRDPKSFNHFTEGIQAESSRIRIGTQVCLAPECRLFPQSWSNLTSYDSFSNTLDLLKHIMSSQTSVSLLTLFPLLRVPPHSLLTQLPPLKFPFHMKLFLNPSEFVVLYVSLTLHSLQIVSCCKIWPICLPD